MKKKNIRYLSISDIHLGHPLNTTENITNNFIQYFKDNHNYFKTLDSIFLVGDLYDSLLPNNSNNYLIATECLTFLISYCRTYKIKLRVLEGTPSHDWKQSKAIYNIIKKLEIDVDFKYIDTLHIETMIDLGLTILYVPDEYKHKASETYQDVLDLLKENNLKQVDIAIMHGAFNYQLPMIKLESSHDEQNYLDIVRYYISIGHIHTSSVYQRILAQGSFDRLAHNEEEDKGAMLITISPNKSEYYFIKNKNAMIFKTFDYRNNTIEEIHKLLAKDIKKIPINSHIRLYVSKKVLADKTLKTIKSIYPLYTFKMKNPNEEDIVKTEKINGEVILPEGFSITRDNIKQLMVNELEKHKLSSTEQQLANSELEKIMDSIL